jgi:YfiH family protein
MSGVQSGEGNDDDAHAPARPPLRARLAAAGLDWIAPDWGAPANVHAFVTTRNGGVSTGAHATLDLGGTGNRAEHAAAIAENRRRVERFLPSPPRWLSQIHGHDVVDADAASPALVPRADAAVTRQPDIVLAIRVADCMPVLFAHRDGVAIAAAHAGWRGLAGGVLERTLEAMRCEPGDVVAWLGPAIGRTAFEVGADVHDAFVRDDAGANLAFAPLRPGKWLADLDALARRRLSRAGVGSVVSSNLCTHGDPARFFSYRRDGASGRMAAFVWRTGLRA